MILKVVGIKSCRPRLQNTRAPSGSMKVVHSRKHVLLLVKPVGKLSPGDETVGWNFACCPMLVTAATNSGSIRFFSPCTLPNRKVGPGHAPFWLSMTPHT
uniref:Uncharacterized protein n=1 Tax=Physcomitrium patens TaxID=3218 RepID=A0A2K1IXP9_PHYPA|nr:hypothetical protein PHYPA_023869 [Physcomitrium patens]